LDGRDRLGIGAIRKKAGPECMGISRMSNWS